MIRVKIDLEGRVAYVDRDCAEKYARKLLQDKLKAESMFKGGWNCFITNRDKTPHVRDGKPHAFIPHTSDYRDWTDLDDKYYIFEISNPYASLSRMLYN